MIGFANNSFKIKYTESTMMTSIDFNIYTCLYSYVPI